MRSAEKEQTDASWKRMTKGEAASEVRQPLRKVGADASRTDCCTDQSLLKVFFERKIS
jgi:hypothetical protein